MMGAMPGLEGVEQSRTRGAGGAAWSSTVSSVPVQPSVSGGPFEDRYTLRALERHGNPGDHEVELESVPGAARDARRLAQWVVLRFWGLSPQVADHVVLLVSELVANAVKHTGARSFGLRLTRRRGRLRVEVRDPSRGLPCLLPVGELDVTGRGLALVDRVSDRWGADLLPRGKVVWFELRVADR
ncbi:ATP-binding protein [Streptomyces sp. BI20]|uniref:ATP-binding protein n=1 Tax=Streptomyces sp. BI20 TaxID=3403460 RepID=UPI003C71D8FB